MLNEKLKETRATLWETSVNTNQLKKQNPINCFRELKGYSKTQNMGWICMHEQTTIEHRTI